MVCVCLTFHKFTETEKVQNNIGVESNAAEFGNNRSKTFRKQSILFEKYKNIGYRWKNFVLSQYIKSLIIAFLNS